MARILVIEDDEVTARVIVEELQSHGQEAEHRATGAEAIARAGEVSFDCLTLDRMLPDMDGLEVLGELRRLGVTAPVLMISALSDVDDRIAGLRAGGDDYLVKPFAPSEMAVRVEVLLRRASAGGVDEPVMLQGGGIVFDLVRRSVTINGEPVKLLHMELRLLEFLMRNAGEVVSRRIIFEKVWGYFFDPGANLINVHIARLRRKLDQPGTPSPIVTVKGEGYRFDAG
ncbi:response regulator transcription factor [Novosphingobium sp. 9]|uniref:response regulator transcription factor n=1 Tax=Novosphingobium sp. 9 TaxID=2025349 RepID=UPI0021B5EC4E|nr:response regulator transcription factor [Novosphingobium sp. 9]